jgi:hypothetical protein
VVLAVVNLDPRNAQSGWTSLALDELGLEDDETFEVHDLLTDARYRWTGARNYVELRPQEMRRTCSSSREHTAMTRFHEQGASPATPATPVLTAGDPLWYKDAVIYQVHVKAFRDSNDDGVGDFPGLTQSLPYIRDLGVNTVWLLPFYPSPLKDDGYDIADYHGVHPHYGTTADFRHFLREAHRLGLRVITELVINHTSDQHPWFQAARRAPRGSIKRDYYVWSDDDTRWPETRIIFTDTEKSNWAWDPVAKQYYWHRFFSHQPDLNFDNPTVVRAVIRVMRYWFDMGVDGMRLDAIPYLRERDGTNNENLPETHEVLKRMRAELDAHYQNRFFLAEVNQWPEDVRPYFGDGDECHMAFHFPLMPRIYMALAEEDRHAITDIMGRRRRSRRTANGRSSCATTTSSRSRWSPSASATTCTARTRPTGRCASTSASAAGSRRSWRTTGRRSSS